MRNKAVFEHMTKEQFKHMCKTGAINNILPSNFFLKDKWDASGEFDKLKGRLVCCGNYQTTDTITSKETESPTININTVLIMLSIAAKLKLKKRIYDVSGAFLNAKLDKPEFMRINKEIAGIMVDNDPNMSKYIMDDGSMIVKLLKALYGLKQASRKWYELLKSVLVKNGYEMSKIDPCLFIKKGQENTGDTYILVYVDDLLVLGKEDELCQAVKDLLIKEFIEITEKEGNKLSFIGLEITTDEQGNIKLSQIGYIKKILEEYNISEESLYPTDEQILQYGEDEAKCDNSEYLTLLMKIMFLAIRTRTDALYATIVLASRNINPIMKDYKRLIKILHYFNRTINYGLIYKSEGEIHVNCFVDASFNSHYDARGHEGFIIFPDLVGSAGILVKSIKQKHVADSSAEAELMALHECVKHLIYIISIYEELGFHQIGVPVFQDNQAVIKISSSESTTFKGRSKFINRKYFSVHEYVSSGEIELVYVGTDTNVADFLTKALTGDKFKRFRIDIMGSLQDIKRGQAHSDHSEY